MYFNIMNYQQFPLGFCQVKKNPKIREKLGLARQNPPTPLFNFYFFGNMYNKKKLTQKTQNFQKNNTKSELGLDPPTHFRVFLGFLDFLPWQNLLGHCAFECKELFAVPWGHCAFQWHTLSVVPWGHCLFQSSELFVVPWGSVFQCNELLVVPWGHCVFQSKELFVIPWGHCAFQCMELLAVPWGHCAFQCKELFICTRGHCISM